MKTEATNEDCPLCCKPMTVTADGFWCQDCDCGISISPAGGGENNTGSWRRGSPFGGPRQENDGSVDAQ